MNLIEEGRAVHTVNKAEEKKARIEQVGAREIPCDGGDEELGAKKSGGTSGGDGGCRLGTSTVAA